MLILAAVKRRFFFGTPQRDTPQFVILTPLTPRENPCKLGVFLARGPEKGCAGKTKKTPPPRQKSQGKWYFREISGELGKGNPPLFNVDQTLSSLQ